jgi:hypothetical protein
MTEQKDENKVGRFDNHSKDLVLNFWDNSKHAVVLLTEAASSTKKPNGQRGKRTETQKGQD